MRKKKFSKELIIIILLAVFVTIICSVFLYVKATKNHEYYCDDFILHVDSKEIDLKQIKSDITSVVEILPITKFDIAIMCRVNEDTNYLLLYDFKKKDFIFSTYGNLMAWVQDNLESFLYLNKDVVYNMNNEVIYQAPKDKHIEMIEYIENNFTVTITDMDYSNPTQIQVP